MTALDAVEVEVRLNEKTDNVEIRCPRCHKWTGTGLFTRGGGRVSVSRLNMICHRFRCRKEIVVTFNYGSSGS